MTIEKYTAQSELVPTYHRVATPYLTRRSQRHFGLKNRSFFLTAIYCGILKHIIIKTHCTNSPSFQSYHFCKVHNVTTFSTSNLHCYIIRLTADLHQLLLIVQIHLSIKWIKTNEMFFPQSTLSRVMH